ncbi:ATP-binding protein [Streptomyces sp. 21So2-11]|uniref:ATP-binding protein n=1 Tax=Streptomyces sp. 21So2-11 TaxID=3144408 RepID=UPI003219C02C
MSTQADREYTLDMEAVSARVPQARRIVAAHLRHWGLETLIQPVSLGVCELLTNVQRHAAGDKRCTLELRWTGRSLTTAVLDQDRRLPQLRTDQPEAARARGRGLAMVASLSDSWGTHRTPEGKVVWFTLRTEIAAGLPLDGLVVLPTDTVAARPQGQAAGTEPAAWAPAPVLISTEALAVR